LLFVFIKKWALWVVERVGKFEKKTSKRGSFPEQMRGNSPDHSKSLYVSGYLSTVVLKKSSPKTEPIKEVSNMKTKMI